MSSKRDDTPPPDCGCREYDHLSRRSFLGVSGGFLALTAGQAWLPRVAFADSHSSSRDIVVNLFLRGGWDSLSVCVPYSEPNYYARRPTLAIAEPNPSDPGAALDLDGRFGFAPALEPLMEAYQEGNLLVVHATGSNDPTRSHFDAMRFMETGSGSEQPQVFTGWLGRHLQTTSPSEAQGILRALALGFALPQSLAGAPQALPLAEPESFGLEGRPESEAERRAALERLYANAADYLRISASNTLATIDRLQAIDFENYQPAGGALYPEGELGMAMRSAAALIKADIGVEAIAVDYGGWDTHESQDPVSGQMSLVMAQLAQALAAFHRDLFTDDRTDVLVTVMSEFGRNVFENGSRGTDHGHGGAMLLLGGSVEGGRVLTEWPGLDDELLYEGQDLAVTIDYRDILSEIATKRLGNPDHRKVFPDPGYGFVDRGAIRS